jgi:hypothetical protein
MQGGQQLQTLLPLQQDLNLMETIYLHLEERDGLGLELEQLLVVQQLVFVFK